MMQAVAMQIATMAHNSKPWVLSGHALDPDDLLMAMTATTTAATTHKPISMPVPSDEGW